MLRSVCASLHRVSATSVFTGVLRRAPAVARVSACTHMPAVAARQMATIAAKERPLSPHLTIYKFKINMITSVFFRGTGVFMMAGAALALRAARTHVCAQTPCYIASARAGLAALSMAYLPSSITVSSAVYALQQYPLLSALVKAGVAFPLTYHFLGGMRHLAWDNVMGHTVQWVRQTGYGALGVATAVTVVAMFTQFNK